MEKQKVRKFKEFYTALKKSIYTEFDEANFDFRQEMFDILEKFTALVDVSLDKIIRIIVAKKYEKLVKIINREDKTKEEKLLIKD
jgi:hypothetical protein